MLDCNDGCLLAVLSEGIVSRRGRSRHVGAECNTPERDLWGRNPLKEGLGDGEGLPKLIMCKFLLLSSKTTPPDQGLRVPSLLADRFKIRHV